MPHHNKFKLFRVDDVEDDDMLNDFLNSGLITPHSISVDNYYDDSILVLVGYTDITVKSAKASITKYDLVEVEITDIAFNGLVNIGDEIEKSLNNIFNDEAEIICQDIQYKGENATITFLVSNY